jgi:Zn-dependent alcohol dehydrogenase
VACLQVTFAPRPSKAILYFWCWFSHLARLHTLMISDHSSTCFFVPLICSLGLGAAWNVADISKGSSVVIFGFGTVGLSVSKLLL